jgi:hypothetical protein
MSAIAQSGLTKDTSQRGQTMAAPKLYHHAVGVSASA